MSRFRNNIALRCGIGAAVIAEYLWNLLAKEVSDGSALQRHGRYWCRCSMQVMAGQFPFLSIHMVKSAVRILKEKKIIKCGCFNDNRFDHTNWYTFTDYGEKLMGEGYR